MRPEDRDPALQRAIDKAGSIAALARALGINRQAVSEWRVVPAAQVGRIESLTGVSRYDLRPDLWLRKAAQ